MPLVTAVADRAYDRLFADLAGLDDPVERLERYVAFHLASHALRGQLQAIAVRCPDLDDVLRRRERWVAATAAEVAREPARRRRPGRRRDGTGRGRGPRSRRAGSPPPCGRPPGRPSATEDSMNEQEQAFLGAHVWAVLATTRRDGSPQQSMVGYVVDDEGRLVMSTKAYTAKWHNVRRRPSVSLTVPDGRVHLVVDGPSS